MQYRTSYPGDWLMNYESKRRSTVKALSWRIIATLTTAIIVLGLTGKTELAVTAGALDISIKLIFYYLLERGWNKIEWGMV